MIIDMHTHLGFRDGVAKPFWDGWAEVAALRLDVPLDAVQQRVPDFWDSRPTACWTGRPTICAWPRGW